ncbi:MAG: signal peptidase II [Helicobacteraceae bacterium]|jgi:signal peptidase II|nr:signal peptidase II [Helicobacteraceae bacterium]
MTNRKTAIFFAVLSGVFLIDRLVKFIVLSGFRWESEALSVTLAFNDGVAFSWFAFFGEWLKYIQLLIIGGVAVYAFAAKLMDRYFFPLALVFGAGASNVLDRFIHGGVVDYIYWHYWFDFPIFNFADVMIDTAVLLFLWISIKKN